MANSLSENLRSRRLFTLWISILTSIRSLKIDLDVYSLSEDRSCSLKIDLGRSILLPEDRSRKIDLDFDLDLYSLSEDRPRPLFDLWRSNLITLMMLIILDINFVAFGVPYWLVLLPRDNHRLVIAETWLARQFFSYFALIRSIHSEVKLQHLLIACSWLYYNKLSDAVLPQ